MCTRGSGRDGAVGAGGCALAFIAVWLWLRGEDAEAGHAGVVRVGEAVVLRGVMARTAAEATLWWWVVCAAAERRGIVAWWWSVDGREAGGLG